MPLVITQLRLELPRAAAAGISEGIWAIDQKAGVQIFECGGLLCGRIAWLQKPRNSAGQPKRDTKNPGPISRQRILCGQTILWGLQPVSQGRWKDGSLYNPDDGKTYSVAAELRSTDTIVARIYVGVPLFGETKTLLRVARLSAEGHC